MTRLNKFIAHSAGLSRREVDDLIEQGRVKVNGARALLGAQVSDVDIVAIDDTPLSSRQPYMYIMLHKPIGYVCSRRRQGDTPTVYELLPSTYQKLKPVGRLDKDSSGIILLTDDGDFAHEMTHPRFHKTKSYTIKLDTALEPLHQQMITEYGINLEDGNSRFMIERDGDTYHITMHEGRNRQIRRTFTALGYTVTMLHRTVFGQYTLGELPSGKYKQTAR